MKHKTDTRNDRFNRSMVSFDQLTASFAKRTKKLDISKIAVFSDHGASVERMIRQIDGESDEDDENDEKTPLALPPQKAKKLNSARMRLNRAGLGHLVPTLYLIVKNVNNRKESIWQIAKSLLIVIVATMTVS